MDAHNFAYWLNGFAELTGDEPPTASQWKSIKEHLGLVFAKVTPAVAPGVVMKGEPDRRISPFLRDYLIKMQGPAGQPLRAECSTEAVDAGEMELAAKQYGAPAPGVYGPGMLKKANWRDQLSSASDQPGDWPWFIGQSTC